MGFRLGRREEIRERRRRKEHQSKNALFEFGGSDRQPGRLNHHPGNYFIRTIFIVRWKGIELRPTGTASS